MFFGFIFEHVRFLAFLVLCACENVMEIRLVTLQNLINEFGSCRAIEHAVWTTEQRFWNLNPESQIAILCSLDCKKKIYLPLHKSPTSKKSPIVFTKIKKLLFCNNLTKKTKKNDNFHPKLYQVFWRLNFSKILIPHF